MNLTSGVALLRPFETLRAASSFVEGRTAALFLFCAVAIACAGAAAPGPPAIALDVPSDANGRASVVVSHVQGEVLAKLRNTTPTREQWNAVLRVSIADDQPPIVGDYTIAGDAIRFTPMFPLDPGRSYHVVFDPTGGAATSPGASWRMEKTVALPAVARDPSTVVSHVYPSGEVVPENQLRMYVHFSAPMGRQGGLDFIRLLDARGETVVDPFLPLDAEFWNDDHTRYTVFFDPGRQKRGITPNQQMGRSLVTGQRYTLVVDREWRDGNGLPLKESFRREFTVGPADERPLDAKTWRIDAPAAGTRDAVVVRFPEALDHGLLLRALAVATPSGQPLAGEIAIDEGETRWRFTPREAWRRETYQLVALGMLEDLAGNRIGRAFEVDQFDRTDRSSEPERTTIPFAVHAR